MTLPNLKSLFTLLRGTVKKNSIFADIVQIGGREVNPISKKLKDKLGLSCAKLKSA